MSNMSKVIHSIKVMLYNNKKSRILYNTLCAQRPQNQTLRHNFLITEDRSVIKGLFWKPQIMHDKVMS